MSLREAKAGGGTSDPFAMAAHHLAFLTLVIYDHCCVVHARRRVGRFIGNRHGRGEGWIWLDDVECDGTETDIADCPRRLWGDFNYCDFNKAVSISCVTGIKRIAK